MPLGPIALAGRFSTDGSWLEAGLFFASFLAVALAFFLQQQLHQRYGSSSLQIQLKSLLLALHLASILAPVGSAWATELPADCHLRLPF